MVLPFHGGIMGSIPVRVTISLARKQRRYVVCEFFFCLKIGLVRYFKFSVRNGTSSSMILPFIKESKRLVHSL